MRRLAGAKLSTQIHEEQLAVQLSAEAVEALAFLLWRHLEHYLLYSSTATAVTPDTPYQVFIENLQFKLKLYNIQLRWSRCKTHSIILNRN